MRIFKKFLLITVLLSLSLTGCVKLPGPGEQVSPSEGTGPAQTQHEDTSYVPGEQEESEAVGGAKASGAMTSETEAATTQTATETAAEPANSILPAASTEAAAQCLEDVAESLNTLGTLLSDLDDISESDLEIPES